LADQHGIALMPALLTRPSKLRVGRAIEWRSRRFRARRWRRMRAVTPCAATRQWFGIFA
jgi:hypothetical protein